MTDLQRKVLACALSDKQSCANPCKLDASGACHLSEDALVKEMLGDMKEGPMKTMLMRVMTCGMVSNATSATCEAKGCTYRSGGGGGGGFGFGFGGGGSGGSGGSGGGVFTSTDDGKPEESFGENSDGTPRNSDGEYHYYNNSGGGGTCDYLPSSADVATLMSAEIPGTQPVCPSLMSTMMSLGVECATTEAAACGTEGSATEVGRCKALNLFLTPHGLKGVRFQTS